MRTFKQVLRELIADVRKLVALWSVVPADCRMSLVVELLCDPAALRHRYAEDRRFRQQLAGRWR